MSDPCPTDLYHVSLSQGSDSLRAGRSRQGHSRAQCGTVQNESLLHSKPSCQRTPQHPFPFWQHPEQARHGKEEEKGRRVLALEQHERIQPDEGGEGVMTERAQRGERSQEYHPHLILKGWGEKNGRETGHSADKLSATSKTSQSALSTVATKKEVSPWLPMQAGRQAPTIQRVPSYSCPDFLQSGTRCPECPLPLLTESRRMGRAFAKFIRWVHLRT